MKKCACGEKAIGVISMGVGHRYVCEIHATEAEREGWIVDYDNWRLSNQTETE